MTKAKQTMKRATGVTTRNGSTVFQWGIKAPEELRHLYPTQWAHRCSLGTKDLREANTKAAALNAEWAARFAEQLRSENPTPLDAVSPELAATLAERVRAAVLARDDLFRGSQAGAFLMSRLAAWSESQKQPVRFLSDPPSPPPLPAGLLPDPTRSDLHGLTDAQAEGLAQANAVMATAAAGALARRNLAAMVSVVQEEARKLGLQFDPAAPGARAALEACMRAYRTAWQDVTRRDLGDVVETPVIQRAIAAPTASKDVGAKPVYLRDVLSRWKASKRRKPETEAAAERALTMYEEATGNPPLSELTRAHGDSFIAWLLAKGGASSTAADRLDYVKGFIKYAHQTHEAMVRNTWAGLNIKFRTESPRRPWSLENLQRLSALPLFTTYELPKAWRGGKDAAYWIPLLGIFTGARISELAQLRVVDVEKVDGVDVIRITDAAEGASIKSDAGRRDVPVHSELVRLGFLEYVAALRDEGAVALWPALKHRSGKPGGYVSQWFGELRRSAGEPQLPDFHSLRHTVRSRLASAGVAEPLIDLLVGHDISGSEGARTYTHSTTADLKGAIDRLQYLGLSFPRVFTTPAWKPSK